VNTGYPFDEVRDYFTGRAGIDLVIVYGSFAKGKAGRYSDVDVALAGPVALSLDEMMIIQAELAVKLDREVDVVDITQAEGVFLHKIMSEGKPILETMPAGRALYEKHLKEALYFNADYYPIYRRDQDIRLKRLFSGGTHGS